MSLEKRIASVARTLFLPEFSFAKNQFPVSGGEAELADHVVWVDDLLIAVQSKERKKDLPANDWFEKKVLKVGTKQVRDTLTHLGQYAEIIIENQRGHRFPLRPAALARKFMVVIYDDPPSPVYRARPNHHVSRTAGLIHLLRIADLIDVCRTLITLSEIASYLEFRDKIIRANRFLSERAILGQFLRGALDELPDERNAEEFQRFRPRRSRFDIRWFFEELPDVIHTYHDGNPLAYYEILREFMLLDRFELEQARIRIGMINESLQHGTNHPPVLIATQRGTCFVWMAIPNEFVDRRFIILENTLRLGKYASRADRCIGLAHTLRPDGQIELDMGYINDPWAPDPIAAQYLATADPFLPFCIAHKPGYRID